ncbi:MAG: S41 family peptidase [Chitinivibrionales bacterium]
MTRRILLTAWSGLLLLSCTDPVSRTSQDLIELERVWQYMKVFSLYQDRIPSHGAALSFDDPRQLVDAIGDTIKGYDAPLGAYSETCTNGEALSKRSSSRMIRQGSVIYQRLTDSTIFVRIETFHDNTLTDCMHAFDDSVLSAPNLILDLTGNGGGYLDQCTSAVELFLPSARPYITTLYRRNIFTDGDTGTAQVDWVSRRDGDGWEGKKIVILIDSRTASSAEMMAVALRDALPDSVTLLGTTSFGKGIGQYEFCFQSSSGAQLRLTGFHFFRISGDQRDYHETGIFPDHRVSGGKADLVQAAGSLLEQDFASHVSYHELREIFGSQINVNPRGVSACEVRVDVDDEVVFDRYFYRN